MSTPFTYSLIFVQEPEGGYTVTVPALAGCITYGETFEEAKKMAEDAILAYIESLKKHGEPIPHEDSVIVGTITVLSATTRDHQKTHA